MGPPGQKVGGWWVWRGAGGEAVEIISTGVGGGDSTQAGRAGERGPTVVKG